MSIKYHFYVSGPMTGYDDYNFPAFHEAAKKLRAMGYSVFNPAESFDGRTDLEWTTYMTADFDAIAESASVVLLEGWEQGVGAIMEVLVAICTGKNVFEMRHYGHMEKLFDAHKQDARKFVEKYLGKSEPKEENTPSNSAKDMQDETILEEAHRLVHSDRGNSYGHPFDDFSKTALIMTAVLYDKLKPNAVITPFDVPLIMNGVKMSREVNSPKRDNRTDGAGYWETLDMVHQEADRRSRLKVDSEFERSLNEDIDNAKKHLRSIKKAKKANNMDNRKADFMSKEEHAEFMRTIFGQYSDEEYID